MLTIDLRDILEGKSPTVPLAPGDMIVVKRIPDFPYVAGCFDDCQYSFRCGGPGNIYIQPSQIALNSVAKLHFGCFGILFDDWYNTRQVCYLNLLEKFIFADNTVPSAYSLLMAYNLLLDEALLRAEIIRLIGERFVERKLTALCKKCTFCVPVRADISGMTETRLRQ